MDFPQRDEDGRIVRLVDLLAVLLAGIFVGLVAVLLIDWAFSAFGSGQFGRSSGWLAAVLPFLLLLDEFRAWRPLRGRIALAVGAGVVGLFVGALAAGVASYLPRTLSGAVGATVAVSVYGVLWFHGVRRLR
jgi:hypothetical protein